MVREKGGINAKRMRSDPAFKRTRENGSEFGMATSAGKLLRRALHQHLQQSSDNRLTSRLVQLLMLIKNYDTVSVRGQRNVALGLIDPAAQQLMQGFNFNNRSSFEMVLLSPFQVDLTLGTFVIPELTPINDIKAPQGSTHVGVAATLARIDFELGTFEVADTNIENVDIAASATQNVSLAVPAVPGGTGILFFVASLRFYQKVNAVQYVLANGVYNALSIVALG